MAGMEDRYLRRNPCPARPAMNEASQRMDRRQKPRTSPVEPWRIVRTRLRVKNMVAGPIEGGGQPAGYFTGATGAHSSCDAFPAEWNDKTLAFIGDVGKQLRTANPSKIISNKVGMRLPLNVDLELHGYLSQPLILPPSFGGFTKVLICIARSLSIRQVFRR
ncbi:MAG: hypothetical protein R3C28_26960 [Pirellulaceae bacterium]